MRPKARIALGALGGAHARMVKPTLIQYLARTQEVGPTYGPTHGVHAPLGRPRLPAPVPAAAAPAPAAAPEEPKESKEPKEPTPPKCKTCGAPCELRTARSAKNDGRRYWKFDAVSFDLRPRIDGVEA